MKFNWLKKLAFRFVRRPQIEMTFGEFIDKRSIILVKLAKDMDAKRHQKQADEMVQWLHDYMNVHLSGYERARTYELMSLLYKCNYTQFDFEDQVFELGGEEGLQAAKNSREWNTRRAGLKKEIDQIFGEKYLEVKKYAKLNN